ncbi:hypothetical protein PR048_023600 [Dryococelus australis]|uniref:Uncharacterized protein n=1 Tax=Dryococelus australis TaxID=614101 RepID=A0ABQ9GUK5_9NEOP|nr:hypothetical protein PR048_023600 [Dryococelus australis]
MNEIFYGSRTSDFRTLVCQLAVVNELNNQFTAPKGMTGKNSVRGFFRNNPDLSFRIPESVSLARAKGFTKKMQINVSKLSSGGIRRAIDDSSETH